MNIGFQVRALGVIDVPETGYSVFKYSPSFSRKRCTIKVLQILSILLK